MSHCHLNSLVGVYEHIIQLITGSGSHDVICYCCMSEQLQLSQLSTTITYIYLLHTFMPFKHLDQMMAFLQHFILSDSPAQPKVSQGGEGGELKCNAIDFAFAITAHLCYLVGSWLTQA